MKHRQPQPTHALNCIGVHSSSPVGMASLASALPERDKPCPLAARVSAQVLERAAAGFKKYGVTCARTDLSFLQWLQHLQEELMDAAVYIERIKLAESEAGNQQNL